MYSAPQITDLGSLRELTAFGINKTGSGADFLTGTPIPPSLGGGVIGNGSHVTFTP